MPIEERVRQLEIQVANLQNAVLQASRNSVPVTDRADSAYNGVQNLTPYTESKLVGIDEKECFFDYKEGNISAWLSNHQPCVITIEENKIKVSFEPLEEVVTVNISIV